MNIRSFCLGFLILALSAGSLAAAEKNAASLDELLGLVKSAKISESKENREREKQFVQSKNDQARLLVEAKKSRVAEEKLSVKLEKSYDKNEVTLAAKKDLLHKRMGSLRELFGHLTATTGDVRSLFSGSIISAQFPGREQTLSKLIDKMSSGTQLPTIEEIEGLWFEMQREMTESGKVVKFSATVVKPDGNQSVQDVVRIGTFNLVSQGKYLQYIAGNKSIVELGRQPASKYLVALNKLQQSNSGVTAVGLDPTGPSGGSYLAALINTPSWEERWHQGKLVGYIITTVGAFALLIALWRIFVLAIVGFRVKSQINADSPNKGNPLGRILLVNENNLGVDTETLELRVAEAILKERPKIERGVASLKLIAVVAPLLGLLGTVTGMILTFQAITIFGSGDPQAMASGISSALVTTVLGLCVAIPTVLLHTMVKARAQTILHIVEEQSMGIIAEHNESVIAKQADN
ncbi:MAG: energy transducer TonB [Moraxellaceae bacterium]|nr:MAG: energy transducer TonB [Moraxellaceae bacterium]